MIRCELCEKESVWDVVDENDVVKSYCEDHAPEGVPGFGVPKHLMTLIQNAIDDIEAQLPKSDSIVLSGMAVETPGATVSRDEAQAIVESLRRVLEFIRVNKRMPYQGELPGPS